MCSTCVGCCELNALIEAAMNSLLSRQRCWLWAAASPQPWDASRPLSLGPQPSSYRAALPAPAKAEGPQQQPWHHLGHWSMLRGHLRLSRSQPT